MASVYVSDGGADVFDSLPGTVAVFEEKGAHLPGRIKFEESESMKFMTSGVDYKQSVDVQFQTSLERDVYAYVFGDNMGEAMLHGRAYFPCKSRSEEGDDGPNGFDDIIKLYADKRMSAYFPTVQLVIGSKSVFKGYLTSLLVKAVGLSDEPSGLVYDFTATISTLPSLSSSGSGVTSGS
jgi:hypothetical protein